MNVSEDEVEQRLRALFTDERLGLPPPPDAEREIVAGARRRRRRRQIALSVTGVAAVALVAVGGLAMVKIHTEDGTAVMTADGSPVGAQPSDGLTRQMPPPGGVGATSTGELQGSTLPAPAKPMSHAPTTSSTAASGSRVLSGPLLAADGYGKVKLGMSEAEVSAQGVTLSDAQPGGGCTAYTVQGSGVPTAATVVISKTAGLVVVTPSAAVRTAEGVGTGSTKDEVLAAYPGATAEPGGLAASAGAAARYHFRLGEKGVVQVSLAGVGQDCAG